MPPAEGQRGFLESPFLIVPLLLVTTGQKACAEAVYIIPPAPESGAVLKYKSVHLSGTVLDKPSCDPGMTAKIFVTPVRMLGGSSTTIVPIAGVSTFATDNGNGKWTVRGQVKTADNGLLEDGGAIVLVVEVYCCVNELCNDRAFRRRRCPAAGISKGSRQPGIRGKGLLLAPGELYDNIDVVPLSVDEKENVFLPALLTHLPDKTFHVLHLSPVDSRMTSPLMMPASSAGLPGSTDATTTPCRVFS